MARLQIVLDQNFPVNQIPLIEKKEFGVVYVKPSGIVYDAEVETTAALASARFKNILYPIDEISQAGDGSITIPETGNIFFCNITQNITSLIPSSQSYVYLFLNADAAGYTINFNGLYTESGIASIAMPAGEAILSFSELNNKVTVKFKGGFA